MKTALLLYGATDLGPPHFSADLLWKSGFKAPDPFPLAEIGGKTYLLLSPLELERAEKEAKVDHIVSLYDYLPQRGTETDAIVRFLKSKKIKALTVPLWFPHYAAKELTKHFKVEVRASPFYPERAIKTKGEVGEIEKAQRAVERAVRKAREFLEESKIKGKYVYHGQERVTSEMLRSLIDRHLYEQGFLGVDTIVSSSVQAADPHCVGYGPLFAHEPIVMDVFPLSLSTHYYADQTRTIFKGTPSDKMAQMYNTVWKAQDLALREVKAGVDGHLIFKKVSEYFELRGYPTDFTKRPLKGFIHGLGHGVGLDIHEAPRIGKTPEVLEEGNVVTVEPGLYYHREQDGIPAGGIRLEDMVVVEKGGCRNLTRMPKNLDWAIIP